MALNVNKDLNNIDAQIAEKQSIDDNDLLNKSI